MFIFNLNVVFTLKFYKCPPFGCSVALDFSQEQDFPENNLLQRGSRTPEDLLPGAPFPLEVKCSSVFLPVISNDAPEHTRKICSPKILLLC
jgi:hypothetical protein